MLGELCLLLPEGPPAFRTGSRRAAGRGRHRSQGAAPRRRGVLQAPLVLPHLCRQVHWRRRQTVADRQGFKPATISEHEANLGTAGLTQ